MIDCYLASSSTQRQTLLTQLGVRFECLPPEVDESIASNELAADYCLRLAVAKAKKGLQLASARPLHPVIGSDTIVVCDECIVVKPQSYAEAKSMLKRLSGRSHQVMSSVAVTDGRTIATALSTNTVTFCTLSDAVIEAYLATKESMGRAGGYAIQGRAAAFISAIAGSYSAIMGLPLFETAALLKRFGVKA